MQKFWQLNSFKSLSPFIRDWTTRRVYRLPQRRVWYFYKTWNSWLCLNSLFLSDSDIFPTESSQLSLQFCYLTWKALQISAHMKVIWTFWSVPNFNWIHLNICNQNNTPKNWSNITNAFAPRRGAPEVCLIVCTHRFSVLRASQALMWQELVYTKKILKLLHYTSTIYSSRYDYLIQVMK